MTPSCAKTATSSSSKRPFDSPADEIYGSIRTQLELTGTPIGGNDLLIAAQALAFDHTLVTDNDQEFSRVAGLRVENWLPQATFAPSIW
jgi:tRNA(fMet)-specific endonuclease VapC